MKNTDAKSALIPVAYMTALDSLNEIWEALGSVEDDAVPAEDMARYLGRVWLLLADILDPTETADTLEHYRTTLLEVGRDLRNVLKGADND